MTKKTEGKTMTCTAQDVVNEMLNILNDTPANHISFEAGYHEWNVIVDNEVIYTFDDIAEAIDDMECETVADLSILVDNCIDEMQTSFREMDDCELHEGYAAELKKQMIEQWSYHYGIN